MGYDFKNIQQTQKFAMSERTKCETSRIKEKQVIRGGLINSEKFVNKENTLSTEPHIL